MNGEAPGYPPAPWVLRGCAFGRVNLVNSAEISAQLPHGFEVVNCWPGKTVGGVVAAVYGPGSTLEYSELIVFGGIVRCRTELGLWVSEIYVDSAASMAGGRDIWGLPKEMAEFEWTEDGCRVSQGSRLLHCIRRPGPAIGVPVKLSFPTLTVVGGKAAVFRSRASCRLAMSRLEIVDLVLTVEPPKVPAV